MLASRSLVRLSLVLALVPSLALAAPRGKKRTRRVTPPPAPLPVTTPPDPAATPDASATTPEPTAPAAPTTPAAAPTAPAPSPTPATPAEPRGGDKPAANDAAPASDADVDSLRQEYLSLRDELFRSRARASTVASQLYSTRIQIKLTYTTARFYNPAKATIRLDGASVYEDASGAIGGDDGLRFDGYVAPGRHLVTFRVEATGKDDDTFTSATEAQIVVKAVAGKDLLVAAKAKDSGDIAYEWKRKEKGSYGLGIDVSVKTLPRSEAASGPTAKGKK